MAKRIVVRAEIPDAKERWDETRARVTCPVDGHTWASIAIPTSMGLYFDDVECDCGNDLVASDEIKNAIVNRDARIATQERLYPGI